MYLHPSTTGGSGRGGGRHERGGVDDNYLLPVPIREGDEEYAEGDEEER